MTYILSFNSKPWCHTVIELVNANMDPSKGIVTQSSMYKQTAILFTNRKSILTNNQSKMLH